ncbi:MAG: Gfo/Idh/MocA family oxidoreductase [Clostridia bacterium]|nr:Gfo/Idh/MocA family oxidoreductase [Clostridia bacterium]
MSKDGMNYAPKGKSSRVCKSGDFVFSVIGLDHGHIFGMTNGLLEAGAKIKYVFDPDEKKVASFVKKYPGAVAVKDERFVLDDKESLMVAGACIPGDRCALGMRVMSCGKHYFTDKAPLTTLEQLECAKKKVVETGKKYMVYYSERLHVESAVFAGQLIDEGAIGKVLQVIGLGPHRIDAPKRPDWFFKKERYGGILCDIGSHQIEQYLHYAKEDDAEVVSSQIANYNHPEHPELDDFGDVQLRGKNGTTNYFRVDWFTPNALRTWGDGRTIILGTNGYIEIRKYTDIGIRRGGDNVYLVNDKTEKRFKVAGKVGYPFFGQLIKDILEDTDNAMTQTHAFKAAELSIKAQNQAVKIK